MSDDVRKKQLLEKVQKRITSLRSELDSSFGQPLSDDMLRYHVYEEISRRVKATIESALKDFESGEELLLLKEYVQRAEVAVIPALAEEIAVTRVSPEELVALSAPEPDIELLIPSPIKETKIEKAQVAEAKKEYRKYVRGKK